MSVTALTTARAGRPGDRPSRPRPGPPVDARLARGATWAWVVGTLACCVVPPWAVAVDAPSPLVRWVAPVVLVALVVTQSAAVLWAVPPVTSPRDRAVRARAHGAVAVAALVVLAPLAHPGWAPWAWVAGSVAGTAPLVAGRWWALGTGALALASTVGVALAGGSPLAGSLVVLTTMGASVALLTALPVGLWRLLARQEAEREVREQLALAEERLRFAQDVHDVLGHTLSVLALRSELAARVALVDPPRAARESAAAHRLALEALDDVRRAVAGRRETDLVAEIASVAQVLRSSGLRCAPDVPQPWDAPPAAAATLSLVVKEAATNVLRHSRATWCSLALEEADGRVRLVVSNDGAGRARTPVASVASPAGSGLAGLADRLAARGGGLSAARDADVFTVVAWMPVAA